MSGDEREAEPGRDHDDPDTAAVVAAEAVDDAETEAAYRRFDVELGTAAVVAVMFVLLRLLAVARWDWPTVASISDTFDFSDSFALAFGTISVQPWATGVLTAILLPLTLIRLFWPLSGEARRIEISTILAAVAFGVIAFAMTVTYRNPWTLIGAVGVGVLLVLVRLFASEGRARRLAIAVTGQIAVIASVGILFLAVVDDDPWLAHERITTTSGYGTFDGYVLEATPGFVHVLTHDRKVIILPSNTVTGREILD
ncbi:MAG: hypothetical protein QM809_15500 [Gordonia sp. (in: high G+C Gram-positive bacteria)]|uniref:hypothetical protein n=1 Tax=Gordonia sp. (in: high G+C Gram-positive bacteria) TaxID=84139 RepID=UPI0039E34777